MSGCWPVVPRRSPCFRGVWPNVCGLPWLLEHHGSTARPCWQMPPGLRGGDEAVLPPAGGREYVWVGWLA